MGQRANLFEEARKTVNILKSKAASKHTYEKNFPMSIMRVTRRHLYNVSHELIDAFEKNTYKDIPALMKRYYKLNELHISQLTRYLKKVYQYKRMCNSVSEISQMFSKLFKQMTLDSKKKSLAKCRTTINE